MISSYNQLRVGMSVFQTRTYAGIVEFKVVELNKNDVAFKSVSISGFDMEISKETFNEFLAIKKHFYTSREEAVKCEKDKDNKRTAEYVKLYNENIEQFVADMIQIAYRSKQDAEYGDYPHAVAIQEVAAQHFPNVTIQ